MNTALSLGGIVLAAAILYANFRPWWKSPGRDPKALIPFSSGATLGAMATICIGGLLGWGAAGIAGIITKVGDKAVSGTVGTGGAPVAHGSMGSLAPEGGAVVFLLFIGVLMLYRSSGKLDKRRTIGGFVCGATLAFLPGVAGLLAFLPEAANWTGASVLASLNSESLL